MEEAGRWRPSVSAVRSLVGQLEDVVRFGLTLFPSAGFGSGFSRWFGCLGAPDRKSCTNDGSMAAANGGGLCTPGEIAVPVAERNAKQISDALAGVWPSGGTPTAATLQNLVASYAAASMDPDAEVHAKYVLLVTDGAPTCPTGNALETTPEDIDATNRAIEALVASSVQTFVIGYNTTGPGNEMVESVLDGFAARGGTGDERHRPVEDEASLVREIETIASSITSCDFRLDRAPGRPEYVLVQLDGEQLDLDAPNGWRLVGERTIQLVGEACERFREGSHSLHAELRCELIQPS
jgi:hypothetical protein